MLNVLRPLLLLAASVAASTASAQERPPAPAAPPIEIRSQREDAGARVRQVERAGGRVLQAEPMQHGGREVYRYKVLTPEGRVRVMQDEPREFERPRDVPGFDRQSELTARRRALRDDAAADVARQRAQSRPAPPPESRRSGGSPARD